MPVTPSRALLLGIIFVTLATGLAAPGGASGAFATLAHVDAPNPCVSSSGMPSLRPRNS